MKKKLRQLLFLLISTGTLLFYTYIFVYVIEKYFI